MKDYTRHPRLIRFRKPFVSRATESKKRKARFPFFGILEREKSLELSTYTLARYRSTN